MLKIRARNALQFPKGTFINYVKWIMRGGWGGGGGSI